MQADTLDTLDKIFLKFSAGFHSRLTHATVKDILRVLP